MFTKDPTEHPKDLTRQVTSRASKRRLSPASSIIIEPISQLKTDELLTYTSKDMATAIGMVTMTDEILIELPAQIQTRNSGPKGIKISDLCIFKGELAQIGTLIHQYKNKLSEHPRISEVYKILSVGNLMHEAAKA